MKFKPNQKFWAEFVIQGDGKLKIKKAQKYTKINKYSRTWKPTNSRNFARALNKGELVTR